MSVNEALFTGSGWPDRFGEYLRSFTLNHGTPIRTLSLFSGAGGLDIGFHDAGFDIIESCEIECKFCDTLVMNHGEGKYFGLRGNVVCKDIREYDPEYSDVDFIIGGPPCQTFSAAGRRANGVLGTDDARGLLFHEYVRILKTIKPIGFVFENVYGIIGAQGGRAWRQIEEGFSEAGYTLHYRILDTADYGAPQHRERLIIVGLRNHGEYRFPRPLFGPDSHTGMDFYTAAQAIATAPNREGDIPETIGGRYGDLIPAIPPGLNYSYYTEKMGNPKAVFAWRSKFSDFMYKADPNAPVRTIKAQGGQYTGPFHWENRHFSIPELKRLQTFPDSYLIAGGTGTQIKQIGNSVPPQFARILALSIRSQVFGLQLPFELETLDANETLGFRKRKTELTRQYQRKAANALRGEKTHAVQAAEFAESYTAQLSSNFAFNATDAGMYRVRQSPWKNGTLHLTVSEKSSGLVKRSYTIVVSPTNGWGLPFNSIQGTAMGSGPKVLTVWWKALEQALKDKRIKADLVQLASYYQYSSNLECLLTSDTDDELSRSLKAITSGDATRNMYDASVLADILGIREESVLSVAKQLRELGYEIRNWNTNNQIPEGMWLIPYEFPTLTPLSVQLGKAV